MAVGIISASRAQKRLFLYSGHGLRRVHEKFSPPRFERDYCCQNHFGLLSAKTFDSYFLEMMYVEFTKNLYLANSNKLIAV